jgi:2-polyprenyl-3-methyl-5-hydroxy-6-metoxy-1,4-benzoquinol methylase
VLDAGCGQYVSIAKGRCREITGIDTDNDILKNPDIDIPVIGNLENLTLPENKFDDIICLDVIEHLKDPMSCFKGFSRVLKDGGHCFIATPNVLHYAVLTTKLTPNWLHNWYAKRILRDKTDPFPTYFRANRPNKLIAMMHKAGFDVVMLKMVEEQPSYLRFSSITYLAGIGYERFVNRFSFLSVFRSNIIVVFRKSNNTNKNI